MSLGFHFDSSTYYICVLMKAYRNRDCFSYLCDVLEVFVALLVHPRFLKVSSDTDVFPKENFAVVCQPIQHLRIKIDFLISK